MIRIYSWNVNGIRACARKGFLQWVEKTKPDILAVQEIKAQPGQLQEDLINIDGYTSFWYPAKRKGYSGVALYSKNEPQKIEPLGDERFDIEGRTVMAYFPDFVLINCYFPNSQTQGARLDFKLSFCDVILSRCNQLVSEGKNMVLCGDFNIAHTPIDLKNPKANEKNAGYLPEEREWMTIFLSAGYTDTFRKYHPDQPGHYTWWTYRFKAREKDIGWRIDYHCVNNHFFPQVKKAEIHKTVMGSDHCPISITLDV
jgi:exodeoxyribonuclease-3